MKKIKILTLFSYMSQQYMTYFSEFFDVELTEDPNEEDITFALFTGGEDVNPEYYNENVNKHTYFNVKRDTLEQELYNSLPNNLLKVGICRGAQFLNVMSGCKLIQHVTGHGSSHLVVTNTKEEFEVTSTHHQMMHPFTINDDDYIIIANTPLKLSDKYLDGNNEEINVDENFVECEIVKFNNTNSLCVQGHPEFAHASPEFKKFVINLINDEIR